jgi:hypothetical protein
MPKHPQFGCQSLSICFLDAKACVLKHPFLSIRSLDAGCRSIRSLDAEASVLWMPDSEASSA